VPATCPRAPVFCGVTVLNPAVFSTVGAPLLPAGLTLGAVYGRQNAECQRDPQQRSPQYQGNFHLSAHGSILGFRARPRQVPKASDPCADEACGYTPSSRTAARTSCTLTASSAGSGCSANVSPSRSSAFVRTMWGPGGGPQISGGAGPKSTTDGVP
jgi:hypothetical protein